MSGMCVNLIDMSEKTMYDKDVMDLMCFDGAIESMLDGKRVTRYEWKDKRTYCLLKDDILQIHKKGEKKDLLHPWIINNGDLGGMDWYAL